MPDNLRGFFFITALLILSGFAALVLVVLNRTMMELRATDRSLSAQQALHLAEAGVDGAIVEFVSGGTDRITNFSLAEGWTDQTNSPCDPGETCTATFSLDTGTITVAVNNIAVSPATVTSTGSIAGDRQTIEMVVELPQAPLFQQAVFGRNYVRLNQEIIVNSYDATKGPYTPPPDTANRTENGDIRTNSAEANTVELDQNVQVFGDVLVGANGIPSVVIHQSQGVRVSGDKESASNNLTLPAVQIPPGTPCGGPLSVPRGRTRTVNLDTEPFCYSSISVARDAELIIDGDGQITLADSARTDLTTAPGSTLLLNGTVTLVAGEVNIEQRLTLGTSASLKLYATESASLKGFINTGQDPKDLLIVYTGTSPMTLTQSTNFYGAIYAPNAELIVNQDGNFFGGMIAQQVSLHQGGRYHFDESLMEFTIDGDAEKITVRSWRQP